MVLLILSSLFEKYGVKIILFDTSMKHFSGPYQNNQVFWLIFKDNSGILDMYHIQRHKQLKETLI